MVVIPNGAKRNEESGYRKVYRENSIFDEPRPTNDVYRHTKILHETPFCKMLKKNTL